MKSIYCLLFLVGCQTVPSIQCIDYANEGYAHCALGCWSSDAVCSNNCREMFERSLNYCASLNTVCQTDGGVN